MNYEKFVELKPKRVWVWFKNELRVVVIDWDHDLASFKGYPGSLTPIDIFFRDHRQILLMNSDAQELLTELTWEDLENDDWPDEDDDLYEKRYSIDIRG